MSLINFVCIKFISFSLIHPNYFGLFTLTNLGLLYSIVISFHNSMLYRLTLQFPLRSNHAIQQAGVGLSPFIFFLFLVPVIGILLLALNLLLGPHKPYNEKES